MPRIIRGILSQPELIKAPETTIIAIPKMNETIKVGIIQLPAVIISTWSLAIVFPEALRASMGKSSQAIEALGGKSIVSIKSLLLTGVSRLPFSQCILYPVVSLHGIT